MKSKELKEMTNEELGSRKVDLKHEVLNLRVQKQSGQLENPARFKLVRREIARIETILTQRRIAAAATAEGA